MKLTEYLRLLAANNERGWFKEHRAEYDAVRAEWIERFDRLIGLVSEWAPEYRWLDGQKCTYRIYRDTRFSADKTPYKTHMAAYVAPGGRDLTRAGYYLHADAGESMVFGGLWMPPAPMLRKLRHAIVDNIEEFETIINAPELTRLYPAWEGPALKTIPKGWPKDHPQAALLRLQCYGRGATVEPGFYDRADWPERASEMMRPRKPLIDFLNYSITEGDD